MLAGNLGTDPSALLAVNVATNEHRIANTHYEYDARLLPAASSAPETCNEMVLPYNFDVSDTFKIDACRQRGFAFATSVESFRGEPGAAPSSGATLTTRSEVGAVDELGRPTNVKQFGDTSRTEDDLCVDIEYATVPAGRGERVLSAVSKRKVTDLDAQTKVCGNKVYANDTWEYDKQTDGSVLAGLPTAHAVERRDETGKSLGEIREFDATFDDAGNPHTMTTSRPEDGASRTATVEYDAFGLVPVTLKTEATGVPTMQISLTRDPLTLSVLTTTDPNGIQHGTTFDGFNRPVMSTVTPPGGTLGVLAVMAYSGFSVGGQGDRHITTSVFTDPTPVDATHSAPGRSVNTYLDELGRETHTESMLGADYPGLGMLASYRTYDSLGRVVFDADTFTSLDAIPYGTTRYFNADGTPSCFIRGKGQQPRPSAVPMATNESREVYPTCFSRAFQDHTLVVSVRDAASLLTSSPQDGVLKTSYVTATGRLLRRSTSKGSDRLEYATFTQDRLGHLTSMTRYQDPQTGGNPVTSSWHLDSLGQLLELDEPDSVPQFHKYSPWGELLETNRTVDGALKKVLQKYDALGRLIHSEQQTGGVVDPETVHDYTYDQGVNVAPQVTPTNVLGRLAQATWPTGSVTFSYDDLGWTNAQVFTDVQGGLYVEKHTLHTDGSPSALDLFLPDTAYADEHVDYTYDSAGRGRSVKYTNTGSQDLYHASIIDALGRVREAQYGLATYTADYAEVGRRLMKSAAVASPAGSRSFSYGGFDPLGRERSRTEIKTDTSEHITTTRTTSTAWTYDPLGRLSSAVQTGNAATDFNQQFTYDPLGNLLKLTNTGASAMTTTLTYATTDRDRICRIAFGTDNETACNVTYDELGGILAQTTPGGTREYSYLVDGSVRTVTDNQGSRAQFRYDAFGQVQELDVDLGPSSTSTDGRRDRHYGGLITRHQETIGSSSPQTVFTRKIPLHDGSVATRHGPCGPWTFEYGEQRGNRFSTDKDGAFVQDVDYQPFGKASSTRAQPGDQLYSSKQWNGGDSLGALGVSQLGARIYDPAIGRFISRDPLLIPRTAAKTNPYAFADNDPVNASDPSGLTNSGTDAPGRCPGPGCPCQKASSDGCERPGEPGTPPTTPGPGLGPEVPVIVPPIARPPKPLEGPPSLPQGIPTPVQSGGGAPNGVGAPSTSGSAPVGGGTLFQGGLLDPHVTIDGSPWPEQNRWRYAQVAWIVYNPLGTLLSCLGSGGCSTPFDEAAAEWSPDDEEDDDSSGDLLPFGVPDGPPLVPPGNWLRVGKATNLPGWKKVAIDMEHIASGHMRGGSRVSPLKTLFPEHMGLKQVERAVREAYRFGEKIGSQGERVLLRGRSAGLTIEMWVNRATKTIESAYPVW